MAASQTYTGNGLTVTIADPENITKDECLQLARAGKDAWNSWRRAFPVKKLNQGSLANIANFAGAELRGMVNDFNGFEFGHGANFRNANFADGVNFGGSHFGDAADFGGANFDGYAHFDAVRFGELTNFAKAQFKAGADFDRASFTNWTYFDGVQFGADAGFRGTRFGNAVWFRGTQFGGSTHFDSALFGSLTRFDGAQFANIAHFSYVRFGDQVWFGGKDWAFLAQFYGDRHNERKIWAIERGMLPHSFGRIIFDGSTFEGLVDFSGRVFSEPTRFSALRSDFEIQRIKLQEEQIQLTSPEPLVYETLIAFKGSPVRFATAPRFHGSELHQDTTFEGAIFPEAQGDEAAARAYRTLKLAFAQQHAIREEQRFFKLEMQEEAASLEPGWKRWLYRRYDEFSDFGFSIWRPLARLVLWPSLGFLLGYQLLMVLNHAPLQTAPLIDHPALLSQWLQFTFANMAPLPDSGLLRELRNNLFGNAEHSSMVGVFALVLETAQKLLALIGYFLIGLALRNLFKMK